MTRTSTLALAALALAGVVAGAAISYPGTANSQGNTRTFIPLGAHASGANLANSSAWFIDANDRAIIQCTSGPVGKPTCTTTPIP